MAGEDLRIFEISIERKADDFYVVVRTSEGEVGEVGPFGIRTEAEACAEDMKRVALMLGGIDVPLGKPN